MGTTRSLGDRDFFFAKKYISIPSTEYKAGSWKPLYMRALVTMLLKYAREFSRYLITNHLQLGLPNRNKVVRQPKSKHKSKLVLRKVKLKTAAFSRNFSFLLMAGDKRGTISMYLLETTTKSYLLDLAGHLTSLSFHK